MKHLIFTIIFACVGLTSFAQDPTTTPPINLQATETDYHSSVLTWSKGIGILKYIVSYNMAMSNEAIEIITTDTSIYIDNLVSATQYLFKVRAITVDMDTTPWSDYKSFYTLGYSSDCESVSHLYTYAFNETSLAVAWLGNTDAQYWEIVCGEVGSNPDDIGMRYFTTSMEYVFDNLNYNEVYQIAVRVHCGGAYSDWKYLYTNYTYTEYLANLPISIDFLNDVSANSVGLVSSNTNPWVIGQMDTASTQYLYISNDNGQNPTFNNTVSATSYAYIDFLVPEESTGFYLDFSYKSNIVSENDGLKIFLIGKGSDLDIDSNILETYQYGEAIYNNASDWQDVHIEFPSDLVGSPRRVVFQWQNTDTCSQNSSILVKGISITPRFCPVPSSLSVSNITYHSAEISWDLADFQNSFNLQYKKSTDLDWTTIEDVFSIYSLDNLEENTEYFYRLQANCTGEQSFYSDMFNFTTLVFLDVIDTSTITCNASYDHADFTWEEKNNVKYYRISYKQQENNLNDYSDPKTHPSLWQYTETSENSITLTDLQPTTDYIMKICMVTMENNVSKYCENYNFSTTCSPITDFPYINADTIYYDSAKFSNLSYCYDTMPFTLETPVFDISNLETAELSFDVTSTSDIYVYVSTDAGKNYTFYDAYIPTSDAIATVSYILSDYTMQSAMRFKFLLNTNNDSTIKAKITNISMKYYCTAPKSINFDSISYKFATISWNATEEQTSFLVEVYDEDTKIKSLNISTPYCSLTNLDSGTVYKIVIKATCGEQPSYDSLLTSFTTLSDEESGCNIPKNFHTQLYTSATEQTIIATWDKENNNIWQVQHKTLYDNDWTEKLVTLQSKFTLRNLVQGGTYLIKVRTICSPTDTSEFTKTDTIVVMPSSLNDVTINDLKLYPNPTNDIIYIDFQGSQSTSYIVSSDGKVMQTFKTVPSSIDLSAYPKGIYYFTLRNNSHKLTKKIIKN